MTVSSLPNRIISFAGQYTRAAQSSCQLDRAGLESIKQNKFHTHGTNVIAERIHQINEIIATPWKKTLHSLAYTFEPFPGVNKENSVWRRTANRVCSVAFCFLLAPAGVLSAVASSVIRVYSHQFRPEQSYLYTPSDMQEEGSVFQGPLHIRTQNLGFTYEFHNILNDLRPTVQRAKEMGEWILKDEAAPEVICFQEAFHEDATKVLCESIRTKYPHIIHSINPNITGLNSGIMVASKYPLKETDFRPFDNIIGPEKLSTRGVFRFRIEKNSQNVDIYTTHLQALISAERTKVRKEQLNSIIQWMKEDLENLEEKADVQILTGDLNASKITTWGMYCTDDDEFLDKVLENFDDPFLYDHDEEGNRTSSKPKFLEIDSMDKRALLEEPTGSWYYGPDLKTIFKRLCNGLVYDLPKKNRPRRVFSQPTWGTSKWSTVQEAFTARLDYLLRKKGVGRPSLKDRVEIRRIGVSPGTQSASSDHLPVDGEFWIA